jgi:hypothetical protein
VSQTVTALAKLSQSMANATYSIFLDEVVAVGSCNSSRAYSRIRELLCDGRSGRDNVVCATQSGTGSPLGEDKILEVATCNSVNIERTQSM